MNYETVLIYYTNEIKSNTKNGVGSRKFYTKFINILKCLYIEVVELTIVAFASYYNNCTYVGY